MTAAQDQLVRTLPVGEAACRTGRDLAAVYRRRQRLWAEAVKRPRTAAEDKEARGLYGAVAPAALADQLGSSESAVRQRAGVLGRQRLPRRARTGSLSLATPE